MTDEDVESFEPEAPVDPDPDSSPFTPAPLDIVQESLDEETIERRG